MIDRIMSAMLAALLIAATVGALSMVGIFALGLVMAAQGCA